MRWWLTICLTCCLLYGLAVAQTPTGPPNQILCNKTAIMAAGPTAATTLVAATAGATVFLCGWHVTNTAAAGTFSITSGTQVTNPCDTNPLTISPALNVTSTAPSSDHVDYAQVSGAVGAGLCITPSVATIAAVVWYNKF